MHLNHESLSSIPTSYATVSVGTPKTPLPEKLQAIAGAGWQGIELGFPDLLSFASQTLGREVGSQEFDVLCISGKEVRRLCDELGLKIVMLQPFSNFEGWKPQSEERKDAFRRAKGWIRILESTGCDMLQVSAYPWLRKGDWFPKRSFSIRSAPQTPQLSQPLERLSSRISKSWPIFSLRITSGSPMKTGAGQHTPQTGRTSGKL